MFIFTPHPNPSPRGGGAFSAVGRNYEIHIELVERTSGYQGVTRSEICDALTITGLEVEGIDDPAQKFAPYVIGEVLDAQPHPDADKLQVLSVDTGNGSCASRLRCAQCPQGS